MGGLAGVGGSGSLAGARAGGAAGVAGSISVGGLGGVGGSVGGGTSAGAGGVGGVSGSAGMGGVGGAPPSIKLRCPTGPNDPRLPVLQLGTPTALDGTKFVSGKVKSWHWTLVHDDCDAIVADPEFVLQGGETSKLMFQAVRPSPHHFTLTVVGISGDSGTCKLEVPTDGRGMRIEACWDTSQDTDLDMYLHNPFDTARWFAPFSTSVQSGLDGTTCNVVNCTANLRLGRPRVDFGYADSPASFCQAGPAAAEFADLGQCPNPRDGEDNNAQNLATGTAERIQIDAPLDAQTFRVMVQNFANMPAAPHVFVYCGGQKAGEAAPPKLPLNFVAPQVTSFGTMWRAVDVTAHVAKPGGATRCTVTVPVSPAGQSPYVTIDDPSY